MFLTNGFLFSAAISLALILWEASFDNFLLLSSLLQSPDLFCQAPLILLSIDERVENFNEFQGAFLIESL